NRKKIASSSAILPTCEGLRVMSRESDLREMVRLAFQECGIHFEHIRVRSFPGEHIVVVEVAGPTDDAVELANALDSRIEDGFVTVKQVAGAPVGATPDVESVHDVRVTKLIEMLDA